MTLAHVGKALRTMYAHIKKTAPGSGRKLENMWRSIWRKKGLSGIWEQFSIAAAVKSKIHLLGNN